MLKGKAGMYFLGTFAGEQATDKTVHDDLDFFPFPSFGTAYDAEKAIDAPIDGFMVSAKAKNVDGAKAFMEFLATGEAQLVFLASSPNNVAAAKGVDTATYSPFQKKMAEIIGGAGKIAQFLDRDTNPAFAGPTGMQGFLQKFLGDPKQDLDKFLTGIQGFYDTL
jgi:multiple sugar transport system substrate-binding protein